MLSEQSKCITGYILYFTTRTTIFKNTAISANINRASFWTQTWAPYPDKLFLKPLSMPVILSGHTVRSATVLCCALQHPTLNKWALFIFQHQNHALLSLSNPAHMNTCTHAHTHTQSSCTLTRNTSDKLCHIQVPIIQDHYGQPSYTRLQCILLQLETWQQVFSALSHPMKRNFLRRKYTTRWAVDINLSQVVPGID